MYRGMNLLRYFNIPAIYGRLMIVAIIFCISCTGEQEQYSIIPPPNKDSAFRVSAVATFNELTKKKPVPELYLKQASLHTLLNQEERAMDILKLGLKEVQERNSSRMLAEVIQLFLERGELDSALVYLQQMDSSYVRFPLLAGALNLEKGNHEQSLNFLEQLNKNDPFPGYAWYYGKALWLNKDTTRALNWLSAAIEENNYRQQALALVAEIYLEQGNTGQAIALLDGKLGKRLPEKDRVMLKARMLWADNHQEDAISELREGLRLASYNQFKQLLADYYYQLKKYDSAVYYVNESDWNSRPRGKLIKARAYNKKRMYSNSKEEYNQILAMDSVKYRKIQEIASKELDKLSRKVAYLQKIRREKALQEKRDTLKVPVLKQKKIKK